MNELETNKEIVECEWIASFEIKSDIRSRPGEKLNLSGTVINDIPIFRIDNVDDPKCIIEEGIIPNEEIRDIRLDTEKVGNKVKFKGISIITEKLTLMEAINNVKDKANRISDYISAIHNMPITFNLVSIMKNEGVIKERIRSTRIYVLVYKPEILDLTKNSFKKSYKNEKRFVSLLSHYKKGLEGDIIDKIREYWQIIEDQYQEDDSFIQSHKWVRDLLSHSPVKNENIIRTFGKSRINLSSPNDIEKLLSEEIVIEKEARLIIARLLKDE